MRTKSPPDLTRSGDWRYPETGALHGPRQRAIPAAAKAANASRPISPGAKPSSTNRSTPVQRSQDPPRLPTRPLAERCSRAAWPGQAEPAQHHDSGDPLFDAGRKLRTGLDARRCAHREASHPSRRCGAEEEMESRRVSTLPASSAVRTAAAPRCGTCCSVISASCCSVIPADSASSASFR